MKHISQLTTAINSILLRILSDTDICCWTNTMMLGANITKKNQISYHTYARSIALKVRFRNMLYTNIIFTG